MSISSGECPFLQIDECRYPSVSASFSDRESRYHSGGVQFLRFVMNVDISSVVVSVSPGSDECRILIVSVISLMCSQYSPVVCSRRSMNIDISGKCRFSLVDEYVLCPRVNVRISIRYHSGVQFLRSMNRRSSLGELSRCSIDECHLSSGECQFLRD
ncbi:hypothetical protein AVEN_162181-1 [Araneus ventricosus]|uniref:Uncharacterized protein n=1 Tax=Araneus ventricosus TaxID=182803 RepID=A0A4Y2GWV4_ARAVE|nr:hypothetical protein AVEN_162181-1 [Araneus ventricosus]